mgnify:CR=1 FL=1
MEEKLIIRISNNLGNQMFMYAAAYAASRIMKRSLYYDHISSYRSYKNIYKFALDNFNLFEEPASSKYQFTGLNGYLKRKILKKIDIFKTKKNFLLEQKDEKKFTIYDHNLFKKVYAKTVFMEGYFESEKYFSFYKDDIKKQFTSKSFLNFDNNKYLSMIRGTESVSLCIRQNRFSEKYSKIKEQDHNKSKEFVIDQINYLNRAIAYFKEKLNNPVFFLWSNDFNDLENKLDIKDVVYINNNFYKNNVERIHCDLFLMRNCKHFAVIPSAFNWWGCWLSDNKKNIILRPSNKHYTNFEIKNRDYWPTNWKEI